MKTFLLRLALVAAAAGCISAAQAKVITFDKGICTGFAPFAPLAGHFDEIQTQGFWVDPFSTKDGAIAGDLLGAIVEGRDVTATCAGVVWLTNKPTHFLAALSDGLHYRSTLSRGPAYAMAQGRPRALSINALDQSRNSNPLIEGRAAG